MDRLLGQIGELVDVDVFLHIPRTFEQRPCPSYQNRLGIVRTNARGNAQLLKIRARADDFEARGPSGRGNGLLAVLGEELDARRGGGQVLQLPHRVLGDGEVHDDGPAGSVLGGAEERGGRVGGDLHLHHEDGRNVGVEGLDGSVLRGDLHPLADVILPRLGTIGIDIQYIRKVGLKHMYSISYQNTSTAKGS